MGKLQNIYNWLDRIRTPKWLKILLNKIQDILFDALIQAGKEHLAQIQAKIIEVAKQDLSNEERFRIVFKFTKSLSLNLKDNAIHLLINTFVAKLKKDEVI